MRPQADCATRQAVGGLRVVDLEVLERRGHLGGHAQDELRAGLRVSLADDLRALVRERDDVTARVGHEHGQRHAALARPPRRCASAARRAPRPSAPRRTPLRGSGARSDRSLLGSERVDLVEDDDARGRVRHRSRAAPRGPPASARRAARRPASVTWSSRSASVTSSSVDLNASTRPCGSLWMKPTVSVSVISRPSGRRQAARRGVQRREQHVGLQDAGAGQRVEQRRLAGVGVADERHAEDAAARARLALELALA